MINYLRLLLFPFSLIYGLVIFVRNKCYDTGLFKSVEFDLPVICVGNLAVGGSGKTPVTEYLVQLLGDYRIAILSRGYGRDTKGFILADEQATAQRIGDEPMQFYKKFPQVTVAVCEDRVKGIMQLKDQHDLIILDDAFQHRRVKPGFNILLFEYAKMIRPQFLMPAGNLRESFSGYKRAQAILITKMPFRERNQQQAISERFSVGWKPAFSSLQYHQLQHLYSSASLPLADLQKDQVIFLLSGIANPVPLIQEISKYSKHLIHHQYGDHHQFTRAELMKLKEDFTAYPANEKIIITTEKDAQRLSAISLQEILLNLPLFFLPIKIDILAEDKLTFDQNVIKYVSSYTGNRRLHKQKN